MNFDKFSSKSIGTLLGTPDLHLSASLASLSRKIEPVKLNITSFLFWDSQRIMEVLIWGSDSLRARNSMVSKRLLINLSIQ
ncbi:hypothetical protein D3C75_1255400 [compost metagenome]